MKRIIFGLMLAMMFCTLVQQEKRHRIERHCHQWRNRNRHTQHHDL